jgi:hypothetical protein
VHHTRDQRLVLRSVRGEGEGEVNAVQPTQTRVCGHPRKQRRNSNGPCLNNSVCGRKLARCSYKEFRPGWSTKS